MTQSQNRFEDVRQWGDIRGLSGSTFHQQYQKVLQEIVEIHEAHTADDLEEIKDAIGDSIVTLINLGKTVGLKSEECLDSAFGIIELRKGLTRGGMFVRYAKLSEQEKLICDEKQGNPGNEYFLRENIKNLSPESFK